MDYYKDRRVINRQSFTYFFLLFFANISQKYVKICNCQKTNMSKTINKSNQWNLCHLSNINVQQISHILLIEPQASFYICISHLINLSLIQLLTMILQPQLMSFQQNIKLSSFYDAECTKLRCVFS